MNRENLVVKHNKLIEAKGQMEFTKLEQKLFLSVVSEISSTEDKDLRIYPINIKEFLGVTGHQKIGGEQYQQVHDTAERLMEKVIRIKKDNGNILSVAFLSSAETSENGDYVEIGVSEKLKPYLINLGTMFTKYQLKNILQLESGYSIRIYELLKQWLKTRKKEFEVDELKEFLGIPNKYKGRFDNFETYVLKVAKKEINEHTDIDIDYEKIKRGRRITHIAFSIRPSVRDKESEVLDVLYPEEDYQKMVEDMNLANKKLNRKQIFKLYEIAFAKVKHLENDGINVYDYIKLNVEYTNEKTPDNYYAYLKKALQDDFSGAITILKVLGRKEN
jgi:plasmid replication initiation protein